MPSVSNFRPKFQLDVLGIPRSASVSTLAIIDCPAGTPFLLSTSGSSSGAPSSKIIPNKSL